MEQLVQDLRFAARTLRQAPLFTVVAVLSIAMAIAASSVAFGYVDAFLLRPLPYEEPDRLWHLWSDTRTYDRSRVSIPDFLEWRRRADSFAGMAAFNYTIETLTGGEVPEQVSGARISAGTLELLGVDPILGRGLADGEDRRGAEPVALVSEGFWRRRLEADPGVLGRTLAVGDREHTIVGVLSEDFHFPIPTTEIWIPRILDASEASRGSRFLQVVARLGDGVSVEQARQEMSRIAAQLEAGYPETNEDVRVTFEPLREALNFAWEPIRMIGAITVAAVAFVLLIACANVANLLLSRGATRGREIAVRAALGAGRGRIVRQLLTESLLLALVGGALGVGLGMLGTRAVQGSLPADVYRVGEIAVDLRGLAVALVLSLLTAVLAGLVPALRITGRERDLAESLKEGSGAAGKGPRHNLAQKVMVTAEMSLAIVLLVGTALMLRTVINLQSVDPGFSRDVMTMRLLLPEERYDRDAAMRFHRDAVAAVEGLPGVRSAATVDYLPLNHETRTVEFTVAGEAPSPEPRQAVGFTVSPGYFRTLGIPLLRGTGFGWDDAGEPRTVVIDRRLAEAHWPAGEPIGESLVIGGARHRIVGVAADARQVDLTGETRPVLYLSQAQYPGRYLRVLARGREGMAGLASSVRGRFAEVDPLLPVTEVRTLGDVVDEFLLPQRAVTDALAVLAVGALLLASIGVYGLMAFFVAQRTREIGIQMALGASVGAVRRMVAARVLRLAAVALVIGISAALLVTRFLGGLLYGVASGDPVTLLGVSGFLLLVALLAGTLGARRATRIDPMVALRSE